VDRTVFGVVFLLVFAFSYSEEIITGFFEAVSHEEHELWRYAVIGLDVLIMGATGLLKRSIARSDGRGPRLWRWRWAAVGIVLAGDVVLLAAIGESRASVKWRRVSARSAGVARVATAFVVSFCQAIFAGLATLV
jgi:hypothetical protein